MRTPEETLAKIGHAEPLACGPRPAWTCEFCHAVLLSGNLPTQWDLVFQSAVCPSCRARVEKDGGYAVVKGGAYSEGRPDPRGLVQLEVADLVALVQQQRDEITTCAASATSSPSMSGSRTSALAEAAEAKATCACGDGIPPETGGACGTCHSGVESDRDRHWQSYQDALVVLRAWESSMRAWCQNFPQRQIPQVVAAYERIHRDLEAQP